jgi:hypothetical protein
MFNDGNKKRCKQGFISVTNGFDPAECIDKSSPFNKMLS